MKYAADTQRLKQRITCNAAGTADLNDWIFLYLDPRPGDRVLELGCGTGKQTVPISQMIRPNGTVVAIDIAEDAVRELNDRACCNVTAHTMNIDTLEEIPEFMHPFDKVLASYSIYYTKNAKALVDNIYRLMKDGGMFFCCGPAIGNNMELKPFTADGWIDETEWFMDDELPTLLKAKFKRVDTMLFKNVVSFPSVESILTFWRAHGSYTREYEEQFVASATKRLEVTGMLQVTKRVIGYRCVK